jgi:organic hydroperoxide reductase OsmC/OhrA
VPSRPKRIDYDVAVDSELRATSDGRAPLDAGRGWTPEHLVLAALARCSLASLDYHARRMSIATTTSATASGAVTERDDGTWGFIDVECRLDVELEPMPPPDDLYGLLDRAERGCFVGSSLRPAPDYRWRVNGRDVRR